MSLFTARSLSLLGLLSTLTLGAATIPGLYHTGVSDMNTLLANGTVDPHYRLIQSQGPETMGNSVSVTTNAFGPGALASGLWIRR